MSWFDDAGKTVEQSVSSRGSGPGQKHSDPLAIQPRLAQNLEPADMLRELTRLWSTGLRFKDINVDRGIHHVESEEGKNLNSQLLLRGNQGELEFEAQRYKNALSFYSEALEFGVEIRNHGEFLGSLFLRRSRTYYAMKDYTNALNDALSAVRCYPVLVDSSVQLTKTLETLKNYEEAFAVCRTALSIFETGDISMAELLTLAVKLTAKVRGGLDQLPLYKCGQAVWKLVLNQLAKEGSWSTLRTLMMGTDDQIAIVSSYDASEVALSSLVESCRETSWRDWGQKLAQLLIRKGARYQSLCAKGKYPFHVALRIGLKADTFDLLKWLLGNKCVDINTIKDKTENSLLHVACRSKSSAKCTVIKLLLHHKIDTHAKNADRKIPLDYLETHDAGYDIIIKHMEKTADVLAGSGPRPGAGGAPGSLVPVSSLRTGLGTPQQGSVILPQTQIILNFEHVISWSKTKVQKWLETSNLSQHKKKFKDVDGPLLYEMKMMQNVAPEMFYKVLEESLQLSLIDLLKVSFSLRQIREDNPK